MISTKCNVITTETEKLMIALQKGVTKIGYKSAEEFIEKMNRNLKDVV
jgi:hypothetical protein